MASGLIPVPLVLHVGQQQLPQQGSKVHRQKLEKHCHEENRKHLRCVLLSP